MPDDPTSSPTKYVQLTGAGARYGVLLWFFIGNRLFLGPGHLVSVTYSGMPLYQRYHRFYFGDIASITYGPTYRQAIYFGVTGLIWLMFMTIFALWGGQTGFMIGSTVVSIICGAAAVFNFYKGERCRFFIRTAVQTVEIPGVSTMARAEDIMARISPLIQYAQQQVQTAQPGGSIPPQSPGARPAPPPRPPGAIPPAAPDPDSGQW